MTSEQTILQNSVEIWKFHRNGQIMWLGMKFCSQQKTVGPSQC